MNPKTTGEPASETVAPRARALILLCSALAELGNRFGRGDAAVDLCHPLHPTADVVQSRPTRRVWSARP